MDIPATITVNIPTEVAAELAVTVGAILRRAQGQPMTDRQAQSHAAMEHFGGLLGAALMEALKGLGYSTADLAAMNAEQLRMQLGMGDNQQ